MNRSEWISLFVFTGAVILVDQFSHKVALSLAGGLFIVAVVAHGQGLANWLSSFGG